MILGSQNGSLPKPKIFLAHLTIPEEPKSVTEALAHPDWFQAMVNEYLTLVRNQTWELFSYILEMHVIVHK